MRIAVFGAGAVGGHLAVRLANAGHAVSVVVRAASAQHINAHGLRLQTGGDSLYAALHASDDARTLGPQELVLVTVKATALAAAAPALAPLVDAGTVVVFVQNGLPWWYPAGVPVPVLQAMDPQGQLAQLLARGQVLGGVVLSSNTLQAPGVVRNDSPGRNVLTIGEVGEVGEVGKVDDSNGSSSPRVAALRTLLQGAGLASPTPPSLRHAVWRKLLINLAGSALCTLARCDARTVAADAGLGQAFERLVAEGLAIAAAQGIHFDADEVDPGRLRAGTSSAHKPSMLQDFERGAPLETDAILRAPQALARAAGVATPVLDTVLALLDAAVANRDAALNAVTAVAAVTAVTAPARPG